MSFSVSSSYTKLRAIVESTSGDALPSKESISKAIDSLETCLPSSGLGEEVVEAHLLSDIVPGFNGPKTSSNYYGFVTGGVLPIAEVADNIVTAFDQNVQVHLPDQSIATLVEDRALSMLVELLNLGSGWNGKTFTTGATGANILGLACGREAIIEKRLKAVGESAGIGELGIITACAAAKVSNIQVLTTMGHSSLYKAASVVGLGRASVRDIPYSKEEPWRLNIDALEQELRKSEEGVVSIVALSAGEVNTGRFATSGIEDVTKIRALCDKYGAWLHVDAAFGAFARCLPPTPEFAALIHVSSGLELADSIAGDGHKMLNVPYDCGFFLTHSATMMSSVFQNPNAAYLSADASAIPSPLNIGMENSRRFRALPVYAVLQAYGRDGFAVIFSRQVQLARSIAKYLNDSNDYELLPTSPSISTGKETTPKIEFEDIHIIVIFRAKSETLNQQLVKRINETRKMYVSGTKWGNQPACRIAVSTWRVEVERDLSLIKGILEEATRA